jgi:hypothetical protein
VFRNVVVVLLVREKVESLREGESFTELLFISKRENEIKFG